jgi:predicted TIM-barrel fold metal-dependent hydrolase
MRIIDAHAHFYDKSNYLENLIAQMDECGIEKCCLSGLGDLFHCKGNKEVKNAIEKYPQRIVGSYFIRPGKSNSSEVETAYENGFKMLKVSIPTKPYNDKSFYPLWRKAERLHLPILFHTGIVTYFNNGQPQEISSWDMHPMRLEPIANMFPELNIIIAHLGIHWNKDAAELIRMRPNVYSDITGEPDGWRIRADKIGLDKWLWWEGAFKKLIFGTDVFAKKIPIILKQDKERFNTLNIDETTKASYFSENILNLLGMS